MVYVRLAQVHPRSHYICLPARAQPTSRHPTTKGTNFDSSGVQYPCGAERQARGLCWQADSQTSSVQTMWARCLRTSR
jgi:hypothetical protein